MTFEEMVKTIDDMRKLIQDTTQMKCIQPSDGWTPEDCDTCRFVVFDGCDIWNRREELLERTNPMPF